MLFFSIRRPHLTLQYLSLSPKASVPAESGLRGRLRTAPAGGQREGAVWSWCGAIGRLRRGCTASAEG
ncbi:hypothetical protein HN873_035321 [Arachis hypogaea]